MDTRTILLRTNMRLHSLLTQAGRMANKADLVHSFTNGRTTHSSEMYDYEAVNLCKYLEGQDKYTQETMNKMRRKILAICHTMGWYKRNEAGVLSIRNGSPVLDMQRVDNFCLSKAPYKKKLQEHTYEELRQLIGVFKRVSKSYSNE